MKNQMENRIGKRNEKLWRYRYFKAVYIHIKEHGKIGTIIYTPDRYGYQDAF